MSETEEDQTTDQEKNQHDDQQQFSDSKLGCSNLQNEVQFRTENSEENSLLSDWNGPIQWIVEEDVESTFEECVEEVSQLLIRREKLIQEISTLKQPMELEVQTLRLQISQVCGQLADMQLHKQRLQQEVKSIKRKLFAATKDCIQSQIALGAQQYEVKQFALTQEELQLEKMKLVDELQRIHDEHCCRLNSLKKHQLRPRTRSDLTHCRRYSTDFERYAKSSMLNLQQWYEPRLLALLKRKQMSDEALRKNQELKEDLKTHLNPLREETYHLLLNRDKLKNKLYLMELERKDQLTQHRETLSSLEETTRNLQIQIKTQINSNTNAAELISLLTAKSLLYRRCLGLSDESNTTNEGST
ncbi:syncoilin-like [Trichomycterus rosablanca]|uniref:syncoilin-like n=1 Tax=Trichomycterus rosablanca TaxID=2290929 RepID=UPI002F35A87A